jgi:BED zinc finger.
MNLLISGSVTCKYCSEHFSRDGIEEMIQHSQVCPLMNRPDFDYRYMCLECEYHTYAHRDIKRHLLCHVGDKPFKCDLCEYRTSRKDYLKHHSLTHSVLNPLKCPFCNHTSKTKNWFTMHTKNCDGKKNFRSKSVK